MKECFLLRILKFDAGGLGGSAHHGVLPGLLPKMTEPSKVIHVRNVGHEISEVHVLLQLLLLSIFFWALK